MTLHCTNPSGLTDRLRRCQLGDTELLVRDVVERLIKGLSIKKQDPHIRAFGISGLVAWRLAWSDRRDYANETGAMLDQVWSLIIGHKDNSLRPEALEALIDAATLLSTIEDAAPQMNHSQAQALLELLGRFRSESNHQMQSALATSITFWGLSLGEWDFWTPEMRQTCWRAYTQAEERKKAVPALLLLGLSRILASYSHLRINHASIKIIASEIDRYMQQYAAHPNTSLTLRFLLDFDVRRHVRDSVRSYLQETESHGPFTKSTTASREKLRTALQYDGGEGFVYEEPQPFKIMSRGVSVLQNPEVKSPETPGLDVPQQPGPISRVVSYSGIETTAAT